MKKVFKSVLVVAVLVAGTVSASAQVSINAGYVSTTPISKNGDSNAVSGDAVSGITAGVGYDMNVQGGVGLSWGLNYTYAWDIIEATLITKKGNSVDHFLDVPVRLTYGMSVTDDIKIFGFAGPKFVYAVAGSTKFEGSNGSLDHYKGHALLGQRSHFDIKAGLGAGVQFKNISLKAGYDWGMLNQNKWYGSDDLDKILYKNIVAKSNNFYVTLGFAL